MLQSPEQGYLHICQLTGGNHCPMWQLLDVHRHILLSSSDSWGEGHLSELPCSMDSRLSDCWKMWHFLIAGGLWAWMLSSMEREDAAPWSLEPEAALLIVVLTVWARWAVLLQCPAELHIRAFHLLVTMSYSSHSCKSSLLGHEEPGLYDMAGRKGYNYATFVTCSCWKGIFTPTVTWHCLQQSQQQTTSILCPLWSMQFTDGVSWPGVNSIS